MRLCGPVLALAVLLTACSSTGSSKYTAQDPPAEREAAEDPACAALRSADPQAAGPVAVPLRGERLHVVALGDFGDGGADQQAVARSMAAYLGEQPVSFGLTLGDNFYDDGLRPGERGIPWQRYWESQYAQLGVPFFASLGNHDYSDFRPADEVAYRSRSWCLPRHYYTFTAGPVQFFALDTTPIAERRDPEGVARQLAWLDRALAASRARWKVVYGHHPVASNGDHGNDPGLAEMRRQLLPVLQQRAHVYLAGHDHDLQLLRPVDGVQLLVAGAGGHNLRCLIRNPAPPEWGAEMTLGFAALEATQEELIVRLLDTGRQALCTVRFDAAGARSHCPPMARPQACL